MGEIFYRTYPKKLNKDESNLGFIDIYDLDKRFMIGKILGVDYIIIEDIFKIDGDFLDFCQINENLGHSQDFENQILKAHDLSLGVFLRIDLSKIKKISKNTIYSILNFWRKYFILKKHLQGCKIYFKHKKWEKIWYFRWICWPIFWKKL